MKEKLMQSNLRNSKVIESEMEIFLDSNDGKKIREDIELLTQMGFEKRMINKVYMLLRPESIERAIEYMSKVNGIYQHRFIPGKKSKHKISVCFICKRPKKRHIKEYNNDHIKEEDEDEDKDINNINNKNRIDINNDITEKKTNDNSGECIVCCDEINENEKIMNILSCGHIFCSHCWFNYLKTLILEARVDNIKCIDHECNQKLSENFILEHISEDNNLVKKYQRFKKRMEILKDKNKKICPNPDCDSFLQKSQKTKYVRCENGHKYCFECLIPPHGDKSCEDNLEKQFKNWTKEKKVKRCPRCQMYTEKNEGCNHMTCGNCKFQWCWLCEGKYTYDHYSTGKCNGLQFVKADSLEQVKNMPAQLRYPNMYYLPHEIVINREQGRIQRRERSYLTYGPEYNYGFGIHRLFKCVYVPLLGPIKLNINDKTDLCIKYFVMFLFWLFTVAFCFFYEIREYEVQILKLDSPYDIIYKIFAGGIGLVLTIIFQIPLTCCLTPFMLICFIYHKFFEYLIVFFGIGKR